MKLYSFWAINAPLTAERLIAQADQLRAAGFAGAVLQPRFYPPPPAYLSPEWLAALATLCRERPDFDLIIQDENGWPAPSVDGRLLAGHPELRQSWVTAYPAASLPEGAQVLHRDGEYAYVREWGYYADTLNPEVTQRFRALTYDPHEALRDYFGKPFLGFFCDEPQFGPLDEGEGFAAGPLGAVAWTDDLPEVWREQYGEELVPLLPALFLDQPASSLTRVRFYELVAELFRTRFVAPLVDWCRERGLLWTGHYKGEEHPYFQLWFCGPLAPLFRVMGHVGIDLLERYPGERYLLRQAATLRRQGLGPGLIECCGGAGWGVTPEHLYAYLLHLGRHGLETLVLHQAQYRLTPRAIHDWPPSVPFHVPWAGCLPALVARLRQELEADAAPSSPPDLLVVAPYRGLMELLRPAERAAMNIHNAATVADSPAGRVNTAFLAWLHELDAAGVDYDVISEADLEDYGRVAQDLEVLGCHYRTVIVDEGARLGEVGQNLLAAAGRAGVTVLPGSPGRGLVARLAPPSSPPEPRPRSAQVLPCTWTGELEGPNLLPLDDLQVTDRTVRFTLHATAPVGAVALVSLTPLEGRTADGCYLYPELLRYPLGDLSAGASTFTVTLADPWTEPIPLRLWVVGAFRVEPSDGWHPGPGGTLAAHGPFVLSPVGSEVMSGADLAAEGCPFFTGMVRYHGQITVSLAGAVALGLREVRGAAARVTWDGQDLGWTWGPDWEVPLAGPVEAGSHLVEVELYTTTFNLFGPAHHALGDPTIVTTSHYTGERDFAQPPDLDPLLLPQTHVLPTGLAPQIVLYEEASDVD